MKQFFKYVLASAVGFILANVVMSLLFLLIIGATIGVVAAFGDGKKEVKVKDNSILHIELDDPIVDRSPKKPFADIDFGPFSSDDEMGLDKILETIEKAKYDDRIKGIYLDLFFVQAGLSKMEEIRDALVDFKESGKFIMSYSEVYTQGTYYLASVADEVYMNPEGFLDFRGLRSELAYFKGTLEKLEIEPIVLRGKDNKYKSAVEPFMYDKMSDENREQISVLLASVWNRHLDAISNSRGISTNELNAIADSLTARDPETALALKLVDGLKYKDEILTLLEEKLGLGEEDDLAFLELEDYSKAKVKKDDDKKSWEIKDRIAVVYAIGGIEGGDGDDETIGSERISKAIREAREDEDVKAIVLRVNSPGGSALASEVIWREMTLAKEEKPVIVSMGDLAASGGYYISCSADKIFANPSTITGSIGAFGMMANMQKFFNNKLGMTFDRVNTNAHSDWGSTTRPMDEYELELMNGFVYDVYDTFVQRVAEGRGMTEEEVDAIGQGRVWTGEDAHEIGLVDELGDLEDAIEYAAEQAGIEDYRMKMLPKQKDPFEEMFKGMSGEAEIKVMKQLLGENYIYYQQAQEMSTMEGVQTRLPFTIRVY